MVIGEILREQDIVLGMAAKGKRSALARISAWLGRRVGLDEEEVLAGLLRREGLGSTGIGHGVAIPHAQLSRIAAPAAVVATLAKPVWFEAPDGEPVDLLLALLWPKSDGAGFLPALAHFCRLLRSAELRECLRASSAPAEAFAWLRSFDSPSAAIAQQDDGSIRIVAAPMRARS